MADVQVLVFTKAGVLLAELEPELQSVNWRLNNVGMARFSLAWEDPKCTKTNLAFGNRLLIRFGNGLPDWGGVIDPPRKREPNYVEVTCYTGERLLDWRVTAQNRRFDRAPAGTIARSLLEEENGERPTGIDVGSIYSGGELRTLEYHYHDLLERLQDLARLSGEDFEVAPLYSAGRLTFQLNWRKRRGRDISNSVRLVDGANVETAVLDEQGQIANRVILAGEGTTWAADRLVAADEDAASRINYGYREYSEVQAGVVNTDTLTANAAAILADKKNPANLYSLSVTDDAPGRFADYGVGDIVSAELFVASAEWYAAADVRVIAREWSPDGVCRLEVEEWSDS